MTLGGARRGYVEQLPYLRKVAYLESTGTQWIDTGVSADVTSVMTVDMQLSTFRNFGVYLGAMWGTADLATSGFVIRAQLQNMCNAWNGATTFGNHSIVQSDRHVFSVSVGEFVIDGELKATLTTVPTIGENSVCLFGDGDKIATWLGQSRRGIFKLYGHKHTKNGVLVRDYSAVLDLNSRPALYDEVSKQLFYNQGTGDDFNYVELPTI